MGFLYLCSLARHDRDGSEDHPEPGHENHAGSVSPGVQLLPSLLDPARGAASLCG